MTTRTPSAGTLLVSSPPLGDPNFRRSVVLLCEHDAAGTFGLVLNRVLDLHMEDVLEGFGFPSPPLAYGGPVQPETLHFLHRRPDLLPDAQRLADSLYWGGDFEALRAHFEAGRAAARDFRFYLGYAGWTGGQLASELAGDDWVLTPALAADVFDTAPQELWRQVMQRLGPPHAYLVHYPEDLRVN